MDTKKLQSYISNIELYIFDSDGVLVEDGISMPYAVEVLQLIKSKGKTVVLFTNNSTKHPHDIERDYAKKEIKLDFIISSAVLTAEYCKENEIQSCFIVGEDGLHKIMKESNILIDKHNPDAVIVGMDRKLTYDKLVIATRALLNGSKFIATNPDKSFPTPRGLEPGAGSMIAAIEASSGVSPHIILGKPNPWGFQYILKKYGFSPEKSLMIGDRFETDIQGAINAGVNPLVVNTGVASTRTKPNVDENGIEYPLVENLKELFELIS